MINYLSEILFFIGFSFLVFFFYSLRKQHNRLSPLFALMCLTVAIYVIGYGFELRADNVEQIKFFLKLEYFGIPFFSVFWLMFSYKYFYNRTPPWQINLVIMAVPVLTLFFSVTNEYHHWFYANVSAFHYDGFIIAKLTKGPLYYVNIGYSYLILLSGIIVYFYSWYKSHFNWRSQAFWMFFASIWPGVFNLVYLTGHSPYGVDLMPFGISISAIAYYIALFRLDLLELKEIIRSVAFSEISEGILVIDERKRIIDYNNAAQNIFAWLTVSNLGSSLACFKEGQRIIEQRDNLFEMEIRCDALPRYYEFRITSLKEQKNTLGYVYFIRDITEQKEMIEKLDYMASYDPLTQIYNRRRLYEEIEKALLRARDENTDLALLMLDIDHFKIINDKYGHIAGDQVIQAVVSTTSQIIEIDDIIGRYGGEEFIILLPGKNQEIALGIAENIRKHAADLKVPFHEDLLSITLSIGVVQASIPVTISNMNLYIQQLINKADLALYRAKNNGRNQVSI